MEFVCKNAKILEKMHLVYYFPDLKKFLTYITKYRASAIMLPQSAP